MSQFDHYGTAAGSPGQCPQHPAEYEPHLHPAAGPWEEGEPEEEGWYLIDCKAECQRAYYVLHVDAEGDRNLYTPLLDAIGIGIVRHAEIHEPEVTP